MSEELVINYNQKGESYYCRPFCNETLTLQEKLKSMYKSGECIVTNSGMAAITGILQGLTFYNQETKYNIIYGDEMYCDVDKVCKTLTRFSNITIHKVNIRYHEQIINLFSELQGQNNILLIESCTNPNGFIFDFSLVHNLRSISGTFKCIIDNTWLTHTVFSPFDHGADYVVISLTKYYSAGNAIGGAILESPLLSSTSTMQNVKSWLSFIGHHVSPHNSNVINTYIDDIDKRIESSYQLTQETITYLQSQKIVTEICHPSVHSLEHQKLYFSRYGPSIITFYVICTNKTFKHIKRNLLKLKLVDVITSYGSHHSRLDPYIKYTTCSTGKKAVLFRLALGYNDQYNHIVEGIDEILSLFS